VIEAILAFVFGLLIGSFLNVCIHRWPRNRSVVRPRSHCVRCRKMIPWYDNIPLVSYVLLGGRCRYCKASISIRYPLVEALTGALFCYIVAVNGVTPVAAKLCLFTAMILVLVFSDLEKRILPDEFTLGGLVVGLVLSLFVAVPDVTAHAVLWLLGVEWPPRLASFAESALGAGAPSIFLWGGGWLYFKIRQREGLGFGDVKLIAMVGSFLGLRGALFTLVAGSVAGSIIGLAYIKLTGKDASTYELPFGTFLGVAALVAALFDKYLLPL
jgi:leader peptidase (prepilin peptidase) / N-methyltransferase